MKPIFFFLFSIPTILGCRYQPELLSDYYGFRKISAIDQVDAIHPEFREGGKKIYYFAKTAGDSFFQLCVVNSDGNKRKVLSHLTYNPNRLPRLSSNESFLVYERVSWDSNSFAPYHPRLRKFYPDSILKVAANSPRKKVDLFRFDLETGEERRLTATGNAFLLGFFNGGQTVYYYALEDSIFYLDPVTLVPVRRVAKYFSLHLFGQNREEVRPLDAFLPSPGGKRSLSMEAVTKFDDRDFNRFRYYLVDSLTNKYLLIWTGGNAAFEQGRPPQTEWLDDRRFVTKVVKTTVLQQGYRIDLNPVLDSSGFSVVHKSEVWEIDIGRRKAKKLSRIEPEFDFVLSPDRHFLFVVYPERQAQVVARINTITRKFYEIGKVTHGKIVDLSPSLDGNQLLFTLRDESGRGIIYLTDLRQPKWKTSPSNPSP